MRSSALRFPSSLLENAHRVYLGLLPALATFAILHQYGHPAPFWLFLGGTVAVSVYLVAVAYYTPPPDSVTQGVLVLLDGPLWLLAAQITHARPMLALGFSVETFVLEGSAVWLAILWLAFASPLLTRGQRWASVGLMLIATSVIGALAWPYLQATFGAGLRGFWLLAGILQAVIVRVKALGRSPRSARDTDASILYIVGCIGVWIAALSLGIVLHGE
ncbi:MAG: hypothetical protein JW892_01145 [Anaerolineae bacterium]|nr:hypothetical protein [Anaerolineae bacterium]